MQQKIQTTSTRPYLIRALHEWCVDNGLTPYVTVKVDQTVQVPREFVKDGEIVLNVGFDATMGLKLGNDFIEFKARFGGVARDIFVPINKVVAIFSRENGQGMAFPHTEPEPDNQQVTPVSSTAKPSTPPLTAVASRIAEGADDAIVSSQNTATEKVKARPALTRIK